MASALLTLYIGLLLFFLFPTMPPWLAARHAELGSAYRVIDFVLRGVDADAYQALYRSLAEPNSVAAMPSIHMALTCVVLLRARDTAPRWVLPLALYALLMGASLVYLGEHYVLDVLVGVAVAVVADHVIRRRFARLAVAGS